jgi:hypothetical protein
MHMIVNVIDVNGVTAYARVDAMHVNSQQVAQNTMT